MKKYIIITFLIITLSSCSILFKNIFGFKTIKEIKSEDYQKFVDECYEEDINMSFITSDSLSSEKISAFGLSYDYKKLLKQPMQAMLFNQDALVFFVANCLVPPKLPNLNWNHQEKFESFPPKNTINIDSFNITRQDLSSTITFPTKKYKYLYVVNWNLMSNRQAKLLIEEVKENITKFSIKDSTLLILNNTDDFFLKSGITF